MRAEDAAVHVRLVHDDVPEVVEHVAPAVVVRQHSDVEHVGVGENQIGPGPHGPPGILWRVSVVGESRDRFSNPLNKGLEFKHLVLGKGLRREEIERL